MVTIYGHVVEYQVLRKLSGGAMEILVTRCPTCHGLIGRLFRVSGLGGV